MNLFAYGTLMDRRVIAKVIGRTLPYAVPATLHGYRKWDTTLGYPLILPDSSASCPGVVYFGLNESDWKRLDEYENIDQHPPAYYRRLVSVEGSHGRITTFVYVGNIHFFRTRIKR